MTLPGLIDYQRLDLTGLLDSMPMKSYDVPPLKKHDLVLINGLQAKPQYNGRMCTLGNMVKESGRYNVFFKHPYDEEEGIRVKPSNLIWVANKSTWADKGAMVWKQEYMYSYMIMYIETYAALPTIDMASIARSIASNENILIYSLKTALHSWSSCRSMSSTTLGSHRRSLSRRGWMRWSPMASLWLSSVVLC